MKHTSIPFVVVGRRITISYESRIQGDHRGAEVDHRCMVFEYDSQGELHDLYAHDLPLLAGHALSRVGSFLKQLQRNGFELNLAERNLINAGNCAMDFYHMGYGEREHLVHLLLDCFWEVGRSS